MILQFQFKPMVYLEKSFSNRSWGSDNYLKNGEKFSFSEDSIIIEELLRKIIKIGEKNKGL